MGLVAGLTSSLSTLGVGLLRTTPHTRIRVDESSVACRAAHPLLVCTAACLSGTDCTANALICQAPGRSRRAAVAMQGRQPALSRAGMAGSRDLGGGSGHPPRASARERAWPRIWPSAASKEGAGRAADLAVRRQRRGWGPTPALPLLLVWWLLLTFLRDGSILPLSALPSATKDSRVDPGAGGTVAERQGFGADSNNDCCVDPSASSIWTGQMADPSPMMTKVARQASG
jgi:hypothetical protein